MPRVALVALTFLAGALVAVQPSINARLAQRVGLVQSACVSFAVGALALLLLALPVSSRVTWTGLRGAPWWELTGGLLGAAFVATSILVVPRIGTAAAMAAVVAGQLAAGLALDQLGAFGLARIPASPARLLGVALLLVGAALVVRR